MTIWNRCKLRFLRLWTHPHSRRAVALKAIVSAAIGAHYLMPEVFLPVAIVGNFIWIWVDFEDDGASAA